MARLKPSAPVYAFPQPDGTSVTLDLSIPDGFCDFAMEMRYDDGERRRVSVHHTGEPKFFVEILHYWTHAATPAEILIGIEWVRDELQATTSGRRASDESENNLDYELRRIAAIGTGAHAPEPSQHHAEDPSYVTLTPDSNGLALVSEGEYQSPLACRITAADLPAMVAGMIWRSYGDRGTPLSRLNTATYLEALGAFKDAVRRPPPGGSRGWSPLRVEHRSLGLNRLG